MMTGKKTPYVVPETFVIRVSGNNMLASSSPIKHDFCPETICPFNKKWCIDKQKRFDAWREAVRYLAQNRIDKMFFTSDNMFLGCPHKYKVLCAQYEQKQRG